MPLSVMDLFRDILPKTNCGDCGFSTCLAFASMVVSEQHPLENCPHIPPEVVDSCRRELSEQYAEGKWLKRDMAEDALVWARERSASMKVEDLPERIGGRLTEISGRPALELPYFDDSVLITATEIAHPDGSPLTRWEQVFFYNHLAQGGSVQPSGRWKGLVEFPNTVSKVKTMKSQVEAPLTAAFTGNLEALHRAAARLGAQDMTGQFDSVDAALYFQPLPRVPVMLMFWDADPQDGFASEARLLFDETITEHLDIESIMFLSERLRELLCRPPVEA